MNDREASNQSKGGLFLQLVADVSATLELDEVLVRSFDALKQLAEFEGGAIQLLEEGHLVAAAAIPELSEEAKKVRIPLGQGISGSIAQTGEPVYIPDITKDPRVPAAVRKKGTSSGVRSYFGAPLITYGRPMGVFQIDSTQADAFSEEQREQILLFLPTVSSAVRNALLFDQERRAVERLQEAEEIKSRFMQVVSHELRTPLAVVMGFSETLVERAESLDRDKIVEVAGRTHAAARKLEGLINDLVGVSQAERGKLLVEPKPTSLENILKHVTFDVGGSGHTIHTDLEEGLPSILVDRDRAIQVIDNIVVNARKFSSEGSSIRISARRDDDRVEVAIEDEGRGIAPDDISRIFEPFFQVDQTSTRAVGGLGIGLYLVRQICSLMDTEIDIESELGRGTRVLLRFPSSV